MLYHIEGTVTDFETNLVVIDCGGIGYALNQRRKTRRARKAVCL